MHVVDNSTDTFVTHFVPDSEGITMVGSLSRISSDHRPTTLRSYPTPRVRQSGKSCCANDRSLCHYTYSATTLALASPRTQSLSLNPALLQSLQSTPLNHFPPVAPAIFPKIVRKECVTLSQLQRRTRHAASGTCPSYRTTLSRRFARGACGLLARWRLLPKTFPTTILRYVMPVSLS